VKKYPNDSSICENCHWNCQDNGCTGPLNTVGLGACDACNLAVFDRQDQVTMCLSADARCNSSGYFKKLLPDEYGPMAGKKVGDGLFI